MSGGIPKDPAVRHARAQKAGQAAKHAHRQAALARAAGMTPAEAYVKGYVTGYNRAYHAWRTRMNAVLRKARQAA